MTVETRPTTLAGQIENAVTNCCSAIERQHGIKPQRLFLIATQKEGQEPSLNVMFLYSGVSFDHRDVWLTGWVSMINALGATKIKPSISFIDINDPHRLEKNVEDWWQFHQRMVEYGGTKIIRAEEVTLPLHSRH